MLVPIVSKSFSSVPKISYAVEAVSLKIIIELYGKIESEDIRENP